jgi:hypothetical protein
MTPGATRFPATADKRQPVSGIVWSSLVALLFATFATISFAVDQSVTPSVLPGLIVDGEGR